MSNTIMLLDGACVRVCMFGHIVFRGSEKVFLGMSLIGFDQWAIHLSRNQERKRVFTHMWDCLCVLDVLFPDGPSVEVGDFD